VFDGRMINNNFTRNIKYADQLSVGPTALWIAAFC